MNTDFPRQPPTAHRAAGPAFDAVPLRPEYPTGDPLDLTCVAEDQVGLAEASFAPPLPTLDASQFRRLQSIPNELVRLKLVYEAISGYSLETRAALIAQAGGVRQLFGAMGEGMSAFSHYLSIDGQMRALLPMDPASRNAPGDKALFDAAVSEVVAFCDAQELEPENGAAGGSLREAYVQKFALIQLERLLIKERIAIRRTAGVAGVSAALGIHDEAGIVVFQRAFARTCKRGGPRLEDGGWEGTLDETTLPRHKQRWWKETSRALGNLLRRHAFEQQAGTDAKAVEAAEPEPLATPPVAPIPDDEIRLNQIAALLLMQDEYREKFDLLRFRLFDWQAVSVALGLSQPANFHCELSRHMSLGCGELDRVREEAVRLLRQRSAVPALAAADGEALTGLVARLEAVLAGATNTLDEDRRVDVLDDFLMACLYFPPADLSRCVRHYGVDRFGRVMSLRNDHPLVQLMADTDDWQAPLRRYLHDLKLLHTRGPIPRPTLVNALRHSIASIRDLAPPSVPQPMDADSGVAAPIKEEEPGPLPVPGQYVVHGIRCATVSGGDWLDGLRLADASISPAAWTAFERDHLVPAKVPAHRRAAMRQQLESDIRTMLLNPEPDASVAARFQLVTTLDDGKDRGRGVSTVAALHAFTPLFFYGGTVCASEAESDAYWERYPDAWKYSHNVSFEDGAPDGGRQPDATSFGYPAGNIASNINAQRLTGSERQLRRAANVVPLLIRIPGLPFGLPTIVTVRPVRAGAELFLYYGQSFGKLVTRTLRGLPRWPTVKLEAGLRLPVTLDQVIGGLRLLPPACVELCTFGPALLDWPNWLAQTGWEIRELPRNGDACLLALVGHRLDGGQLQLLRHDIADVIARRPDTAESGQRNARDAALAVQLAHPGVFQSGDASRQQVGHALYADLQRLPGIHGGETEIQAWCQLEDERKGARAVGGKKKPVPATTVAVIDAEGALVVLTAGKRRFTDLRGLDAARLREVVGRSLGDVHVALLRHAGQYCEILQ